MMKLIRNTHSAILNLALWSIVISMSRTPLAGDDGPAGPTIPTFVRHVVDGDLQALGADIGDRTRNAMADIVAVDRTSVYWYARGEKHLIDQFDTPTNFLLVRTADVDRVGRPDIVASGEAECDVPDTIFWYRCPE